MGNSIFLDRRSAMFGMAACAGGVMAGCATGPVTVSRRALGLADLTVMRELKQDYAGTLTRVGKLGYKTFGFALTGYGGREPGEPTPAEKAKFAADAGMAVGVVRLAVFGSEPERELDEAAAIGARIVASAPALPFITGPKRFTTTRAEFEAWLPKLVSLAEMARSRGLTLAYHNHWFDHAPLEGESAFDTLVRQVSPELLSFEIDFANAWYSGISPLALLQQLGPRVVSMHWKDIDRRRGNGILEQVITPGEGEMNYAALIPAVTRVTSATGYVEVDSPPDGIAAAAAAAKLILPLL